MGDVGVQLQAASAAQTVRTLQLVVVTDQGKKVTMDVQVVAVADKFGNPIAPDDIEKEWRENLLREITAIRFGIQALMTHTASQGEGDIDPVEVAEEYIRLAKISGGVC